MLSLIAIIIVIIIIVLVMNGLSSDEKFINTVTPNERTMDMAVPLPGVAHPREVVDFVVSNTMDVTKQVYDQLVGMGTVFPEDLRKTFRNKIEHGHYPYGNFYWNVSAENFQKEREELNKFNDTMSFEIKGMHVRRYVKKLEECTIYDNLTLKKEPHNKYDPNAIKVVAHNGMLGHVPREETEYIHDIMALEHKAFLENIWNNDGFLTAYAIIYYKNPLLLD